MVDKTTPSESLLVHVARTIVFTIIIFVAVLAVDAVVLWLLNLLWNTDLWIMLLWWEGIAMAFLGGAAWQFMHAYGAERSYFLPKPMRTKLYRIKLKVQHPWFCFSLAMAGLMLILVGFLIWQFI
jgi:hypothetical protein